MAKRHLKLGTINSHIANEFEHAYVKISHPSPGVVCVPAPFRAASWERMVMQHSDG